MGLIMLTCSAALVPLVVATAIALGRELAAVHAAVSGFRPRELGPYELAYLDGGMRNAVDTVIAELARTGRIRVSRGGRVHRVRPASTPSDPLEKQVLRFVNSRYGTAMVDVKHVTSVTVMDAIGHRLVEMGMIYRVDAFDRAHRWFDILSVLFWTGFMGILVMLFTMLAMNLPWELPMLAVGIIVITLTIARIALWRYGRRLGVTCTPAGQETLNAARRNTPRGAAGGTAAIALYGLGQLNNPELEAEISGRRNKRTGSYGSGGGGCGGGSVGGGCGSCGGCGGGD
ncbi:TIGR04222 domain-containing membrane protein [Nonomuraea jabiensis]|nr:TIGR04222 domain-containing membrane protein [Nonomuraea jabiensis]